MKPAKPVWNSTRELWTSDTYREYEQAVQTLLALYGYVITMYCPGGVIKVNIPGVAASGFQGSMAWTLDTWIKEIKANDENRSNALQARAARTARQVARAGQVGR